MLMKMVALENISLLLVLRFLTFFQQSSLWDLLVFEFLFLFVQMSRLNERDRLNEIQVLFVVHVFLFSIRIELLI